MQLQRYIFLWSTRQMGTGYRDSVLSNKDQFAQTPPTLLRMIQSLYFGGRIAFDPCPVKPRFDGLTVSWRKNNFVNPPFSDVHSWAQKAVSEGKNTVLLMPARTAASYVHTTILPNCSSIIVLCNSVCFAPYKTALPVPIMLVHFGQRVALSGICNGMQLQKVAFDHWILPPSKNQYKLEFLPRVMKKYKVQQMCTSQSNPNFTTKGCSFICVMNSASSILNKAAEHCNTNNKAIVVALIIPAFNCSYFREHVKTIKEVVFISPKFMKGSYLGSVLVVLSAKRLSSSATTRPALYLATHSTRRLIGPD